VGAAREMFVTALIRSGAFAVAERQRLNEGVMRERQLAQGGTTAAAPAATGTDDRRALHLRGGGLGGQRRRQRELGRRQHRRHAGVRRQHRRQIGMDVRIVDANTGLVVDAVNVVKKLESSTTSVSGIGSLLNSLASLRGKNLPVPVDADSRSSRKEGVDRALRSCIEAAVAELARRLNDD
jgi:curli biogenesis system outer membrane secretion channel CsgG